MLLVLFNGVYTNREKYSTVTRKATEKQEQGEEDVRATT
jgi:hypothetical protein